MATYTSFKIGGSTGTVNAVSNRLRGYQSVQFDVAKFVSKDGLVAADVETLLTIPANSTLNILAIHNDSALALGTTPTFSVGDASGGTVFVNASTVVTAGSYHTLALATKTYPAASTLTVTLGNASGTVATGTFSIVYEILDLSANPTAQASTQI